jgi:D-arabinose 1-dehydrogenase-like Zn-dependent alcohol dehydrogenase
MLAARCLQYGSSPPLNLVRMPLPVPGPREVLIKVTAASLCHTDVAMCMGDKVNEGNTIPQTAGHEPCGIIAMTGSEVEGFREGDRVGFVNHAGSCGELIVFRVSTEGLMHTSGNCAECQNGHNTYCLAAQTKLRGVNTDGCFSEYAIGDAVYCFKIPSKVLDAQAAPLMCQYLPFCLLRSHVLIDRCWGHRLCRGELGRPTPWAMVSHLGLRRSWSSRCPICEGDGD